MAKIQTRQNVKVYVKAPGGTPAAFAAGDLLVMDQVYDLNTTINGESFEFGGYGAAYKNRVADVKDFTLSFSYDADPDDTKLSTLVARWNSSDRKLDVLAGAGDAPGVSAKNVFVWGRFVMTEFSLQYPMPGIVRVNVSASVADGSTINLALNQTTFPSL